MEERRIVHREDQRNPTLQLPQVKTVNGGKRKPLKMHDIRTLAPDAREQLPHANHMPHSFPNSDESPKSLARRGRQRIRISPKRLGIARLDHPYVDTTRAKGSRQRMIIGRREPRQIDHQYAHFAGVGVGRERSRRTTKRTVDRRPRYDGISRVNLRG